VPSLLMVRPLRGPTWRPSIRLRTLALALVDRLRSSKGRLLLDAFRIVQKRCQNPCSFQNLFPDLDSGQFLGQQF